MNVVCKNCRGKIKIPDERVPKGQSFSITCPKCKNKITLGPPEDEDTLFGSPEGMGDDDSDQKPVENEASGEYDDTDRAFDFLEDGQETVLLCEPDTSVRAKIKAALENMDYHITRPLSPRDALKQMRFHEYNMVIINERFGTLDPDMNHVLKYIEQMSMSIRRNIFVALLTSRFRTMDNMTAFNKSVNIIINLKNLDDVEKILKRSVNENKNFYRVYKELMIKLSKI